jgi:hypothetical protein
MKRLAPVLLILIAAAVVIPLNRRSYLVGISKDTVMQDLQARSVTQMNLRMQNKPLFKRVSAYGGSGVLEISTDYQLRRNHVFLTGWQTCKVDTNRLIVDVRLDWRWKGLP